MSFRLSDKEFLLGYIHCRPIALIPFLIKISLVRFSVKACSSNDVWFWLKPMLKFFFVNSFLLGFFFSSRLLLFKSPFLFLYLNPVLVVYTSLGSNFLDWRDLCHRIILELIRHQRGYRWSFNLLNFRLKPFFATSWISWRHRYWIDQV